MVVIDDKLKILIYILLWIFVALASRFIEKQIPDIQAKKLIRIGSFLLIGLLMFIFLIWSGLPLKGVIIFLLAGGGVIFFMNKRQGIF